MLLRQDLCRVGTHVAKLWARLSMRWRDGDMLGIRSRLSNSSSRLDPQSTSELAFCCDSYDVGNKAKHGFMRSLRQLP